MRQTTTRQKWANKITKFVKAELKRADVNYSELAHRLNKMGFVETKGSVAGKLTRDRAFSAVFLLATLKAIRCQFAKLDDICKP
jgi:hypothetical protein